MEGSAKNGLPKARSILPVNDEECVSRALDGLGADDVRRFLSGETDHIDLRRYRAGSRNKILDHFAGLPEQDKRALGGYVVAHGCDRAGALLKRLRIVNGLTRDRLARVLFPVRGETGGHGEYVSLMEEDTRDLLPSDVKTLREGNHFLLADSDWPKFFHLVVKDKYGVDLPCDTPEQFFDLIGQQLRDYRDGVRPLMDAGGAPGLMTRNAAVRALAIFQETEKKSQKENEPSRRGKLLPGMDRKIVSQAMRGEVLLNDEMLASFAGGLGIDGKSAEFALLRQLPFSSAQGKRKMFSEAVRAQMVAPEVARVFSHPGYYASFGDFHRALREAAQLSMDAVGKGLAPNGGDLTKQSIEQWEKNKAFPGPCAISMLLEENRYALPVGGAGVVMQPVRQKFERLAGVMEDRKDWIKRSGAECTFSRWEEMAGWLGANLREIVSHETWKRYYDERIMPQLESILHEPKSVSHNGRASGALRYIDVAGQEVRIKFEDGQAVFCDFDISKLADRRRVLAEELRRLSVSHSKGALAPGGV